MSIRSSVRDGKRYLPLYGFLLAVVLLGPLAIMADRDITTRTNARSQGELPRLPFPTPRKKATKIYIAAPLFSDAEREFNRRLAAVLRKAGYTVLLPQELSHRIVTAKRKGWQQAVFDVEVSALRTADVVLGVLDGPDVDSGTTWELGMAWQMHKPVLAIRTDFRTFGEEGTVNLTLSQSCKSIVTTIPAAVLAVKGQIGGNSHGRS